MVFAFIILNGRRAHMINSTEKTPRHLFVDLNICWMTFRWAESKYVHMLKSQSSQVLFSLICSDVYTCRDEWHPKGCGVGHFFFLYLCILLRRASSEQWVVWCLLSQSMWTLQNQTWLQSALTHWDILGSSFPVLWRPGIWFKTCQRPVIIWRCCSSFQSAAEIMSLSRQDSSSSNMRH